MTAIQNFFEHTREVAKRKAEWERKMLEELKNPKVIQQVIVVNEEEFQEFDSLLRRNWFVDDADIIDCVWDASEEVFERIMKNVYSYPERVRNVLLYTFNPPKMATKLSLKIRELSDQDMYRAHKQQEQITAKKVDEAWIQYKKDYGLTRPEGDVDAMYTDIYDQLQRKKKELEALQKKPTKTYVPPSMRGKQPASPEVTLLEKVIGNLENEIVEVKKQIELEEQIWENAKKSSVYAQLLESVQ